MLLLVEVLLLLKTEEQEISGTDPEFHRLEHVRNVDWPQRPATGWKQAPAESRVDLAIRYILEGSHDETVEEKYRTGFVRL